MSKRYMLVDVDDATGQVSVPTAESVVTDEEFRLAGRLLANWYSEVISDGVGKSAIGYALIQVLAVILSCGVQPDARERNWKRASDALRAAMMELP